MKIYINRFARTEAWGGGNHAIRAVQDSPLFEIVDNFTIAYDTINHQHIQWQGDRPDLILIMGIDEDVLGPKIDGPFKGFIFSFPKLEDLLHHNVKKVLRVNDCDARKGTTHVDLRLIEASKYIDGTIFVSQWMYDYFMKKGWACPRNRCTVIHNGVDASIFHNRSKLNNGKINIVAHHWSDNPLKGFDIYEHIDEFVGHHDEFTFTYIGRDRSTFKNTQCLGVLFGEKLGEELGKRDIYVSASRFDPGPNHIAESIACGLPTYVHTNGGGCVEFADNDHVFHDWNELKHILLNKKFSANSTSFGSWKMMTEQYKTFLDKIHAL